MSVRVAPLCGRVAAAVLMVAFLATPSLEVRAAEPDILRTAVETRAVSRLRLKPRRRGTLGNGGLNPRLAGILGRIERNFGRPVAITSGCRSKSGNRRAGGAKASYHMRCMAADIRVAGVPEGKLLRFAARLPGVGGIGTYCGNSIVHIDVGPRRAWSGGCGRKKRRR